MVAIIDSSRGFRALFQKGYSIVLAKILNFLYPFFLAKIGQEKVFGNVLDRKPVFLDFQYID